jgi:hypothetical protein
MYVWSFLRDFPASGVNGINNQCPYAINCSVGFYSWCAFLFFVSLSGGGAAWRTTITAGGIGTATYYSIGRSNLTTGTTGTAAVGIFRHHHLEYFLGNV